MTGNSNAPEATNDVSLVVLAAILVRHLRLLVALPAVMVVFVSVMYVLGPRMWVAQSRLLPETPQRDVGPLSGLAAQLALNIGASQTEPLDFYADLMTSTSVLDSLALTTFGLTGVAKSDQKAKIGTLLDVLNVSGATKAERLRRARNRLRRDIAVQPVRRSGMLSASTRAGSAALAEALNRRLLDLVSTFNQERRQSRAAAERRFIEGRLDVVRDSLARAQAALIQFGRHNRYLTSVPPDLFVERSRLEHAVALLEQVQTTLAQSYERARLDEVRNTPVITVVDPPEGTAQPEGGLARRIAIALVVGVMLALAIAFLQEHVARRRLRAPEEINELRKTWRRIARSPQRAEVK